MGINLPMFHPPRPSQTATINPVDVALFANAASPATSILLANNLNVFEGTSTTAFAVVACSGTGNTFIDPGVNTGSLWAVGTVTFPSGSTLVVHGSLRTTGGANESPGQVSGSVFDPTVIDRQLTTITATFPVVSGSPFTLNPADPPTTISAGAITNIFVNGSTLTINPGSYGDLTVNGGTLTLLPGTYTFTNVTLNTSGTFQSNGVNALIRVYVRNTLIFRAACATATGSPNGYQTSNIRWAAFGTGGATLGPRTNPDTNPFRGTIVAMNGPFIIEDGARTYQGGFFGQSVTVHASATVQHVGFSAAAWETPTG
jgi:hypothetical protein